MKTNVKFPIILLAVILITSAGFGTAAAYDHKIDADKISFEWKVDGQTLQVRLSAATDGWVGIGFNPSNKMKDANFILGYVKNGQVSVVDHVGTATYQHQEDTKSGGKENVTVVGGQEANGNTTIEFVIPLDSGDAQDQPLAIDKPITVLLGYGAGRDSFRSKHEFKAVLEVHLQTGEFKRLK